MKKCGEAGNVVDYKDGQNVKIIGIISKIKKKITRNNTIMAFVTLDDLYGSFETIIFESVYNRCGDILQEENIVLIEGRLSIREDEPTKIIVTTMKEILNEEVQYPYINIDITNFSEQKKEELRNLIRFYSKMIKRNAEIDVTVDG